MMPAMGNVIFIFVRWSQHFASFYTTQFLPNTTSYVTTSFPILHLLPIDSSMPGSFNDMVLNYEQQIINSSVTISFSDDVKLNFPGFDVF
jgi:hypothetical protein